MEAIKYQDRFDILQINSAKASSSRSVLFDLRLEDKFEESTHFTCSLCCLNDAAALFLAHEIVDGENRRVQVQHSQPRVAQIDRHETSQHFLTV